MSRCLIVLNPAAGGGSGEQRWARVRARVMDGAGCELLRTDPQGRWREEVRAAAADGVRRFVAAGGDGMVSQLANVLVALSRASSGEIALDQLRLGAVGLGSSNDFHKPLHRAERWGGIPLKLDWSRPVARDVAWACFATAKGRERRRAFLLSASVGVVAEGNRIFNEARGVGAWLKRYAKGAAIVGAALGAISAHKNIEARLMPIYPASAKAERLCLTNISVMKTPHLSGSLRFEQDVTPSDGQFAVYVCEGMGRGAMLRTFVDLSRGRFVGRPGRHAFLSSALTLEIDQAANLELDGEVTRTDRVSFYVGEERLMVCS